MTTPTINALPVRIPGRALAAAIAEHPGDVQALAASELVHFVCEFSDPNLAFCGTDVTHDAWADRGTEADCLVCVELRATHRCPVSSDGAP